MTSRAGRPESAVVALVTAWVATGSAWWGWGWDPTLVLRIALIATNAADDNGRFDTASTGTAAARGGDTSFGIGGGSDGGAVDAARARLRDNDLIAATAAGATAIVSDVFAALLAAFVAATAVSSRWKPSASTAPGGAPLGPAPRTSRVSLHASS